jgi:predicted DCC family thiol-disulfide oxidoreductase YuxK
LVFDGDCQFCRRWIARWKNATGDAVDYLPFQDRAMAGRFPEIPREHFAEAVHLILSDGSVCSGAEAVFRSLAEGGRQRWLLWLYRKVPGFADLSELLYEEVALHRTALSKLDRIYAGPGLELPSYIWVRFAFLRGLALIYLIAFGSYWMQLDGLIGIHGIVPAQGAMAALKEEAAQAHMGLQRFFMVPTFAWWSASDSALHWQCGLGVACALALLAGIAPAVMLFLLWALYLSLCTVSGPFLNFQWDTLLLEAGFLAVFFAPLQLWERPSRQTRPPVLVLWLLRWLLFRLMFESGCVKLMSGDATWWNLTALRVHYETQPLPTWLGWYAHQWPPSVQSFCTLVMFAIELVVPAFIFAGRRLRLVAAGIFAAFQVLILLTGNYGFFNGLGLLLCLPLLDDKALLAFRNRTVPAAEPLPGAWRPARWPWPVMLCLTILVVPLTMIPLLRTAGVRQTWPAPVGWLYGWTQPWRTFNGYGLFAVMTPKRPEIIVQGSDDGRNWRDYVFKYKPGDLRRAPGFVAPYQPRLDWQLWFAALGGPRTNPWFYHFEYCLLQNSPSVLALLGPNPFPKSPPKYVRALLYEYHFTDRATRRGTDAWWRRELKGLYAPPLSLEDFRHAQGLAAESRANFVSKLGFAGGNR